TIGGDERGGVFAFGIEVSQILDLNIVLRRPENFARIRIGLGQREAWSERQNTDERDHQKPETGAAKAGCSYRIAGKIIVSRPHLARGQSIAWHGRMIDHPPTQK